MPRPRVPAGFETHLTQLRELVERLSNDTLPGESRERRLKRQAIDAAIARLSEVSAGLDPIRRPANVFDPTDPKTAGRIVALTLVAQDRHPLASIPEFYGSGVYAIYYRGDFPPYEGLSRTEHPIYVGKADPDDASAKDAVAQGAKLSARLAEHAKNIGKASDTLRLEDFDCRFLIVQSGFQSSAERLLIDFFKPIWNSETKLCFGLGKHGDSSTTRANKRSPWDTMHPGRAWAADNTEDQKPKTTIVAEINRHLEQHPPYADLAQIFNHLVADMRQLGDDA